MTQRSVHVITNLKCCLNIKQRVVDTITVHIPAGVFLLQFYRTIFSERALKCMMRYRIGLYCFQWVIEVSHHQFYCSHDGHRL